MLAEMFFFCCCHQPKQVDSVNSVPVF
uniref:Uncharacterized protein n=1 Tax=Anguilla anguilla TaxID=7936 RepID=A0A0E9Q0X6_ANGAN